MKLISKTSLYYLLISLPLLVLAGFFSYYLIKSELREGTDESLSKDKLNAEQIIGSRVISSPLFLSSDSLSYIKPFIGKPLKSGYFDTIIFDKLEQEELGYRLLVNYKTKNQTTYQITLLKPTLEEDDLLESLFTAFSVIIGFLVFSFFIVNWFIAKTLWKPFYKTVTQLHGYDITNHPSLNFDKVLTKEFNQLNMALTNMTTKIYSDYQQQKEFTENAAHEMQTPLAVIKANLNLLVQSQHLKEEDMNQLQAIENTVKKLSSLNKALLLLSKIDNKQFKEQEHLNVKELLSRCLLNFEALIEAKQIQLTSAISTDVILNANSSLLDILISNLIQNAIRHNSNGGKINIILNATFLTISNTGEPLRISPTELFVRFKKNDASKESLGLGLAIVKSISSTYGYKLNYNYENNLHYFKVTFV
jgi:signal transduction histidine kinase